MCIWEAGGGGREEYANQVPGITCKKKNQRLQCEHLARAAKKDFIVGNR